MGNSTSRWSDLTLHDSPNSAKCAFDQNTLPMVVLHPTVTKFDNLTSPYISKIWRTFTSTATSCATTLPSLKLYLDPIRSWITPGRETASKESRSEFDRHTEALFNHWIKFHNTETKKAKPEHNSSDATPLSSLLPADQLHRSVYVHSATESSTSSSTFSLLTVTAVNADTLTATLTPPDPNDAPETHPIADLYLTAHVVDFMEIFLSLLLTGNVPMDFKLDFLFTCMDFDCDNDLTLPEILVTLKSAEAGLARMRGDPPAPERRIEDLATDWYTRLKTIPPMSDRVSKQTFLAAGDDSNFPLKRVLTLYAEAEGSVDIDSDVEKESAEPAAENPEFEARSQGDQFMAVKPYLGAIVAPAGYKKAPPAAPTSSLHLDHIHGYRSFDTRNNLFYLAGSTAAIYHAAAVTVSLDIPTGSQHFHLQHTDDIRCIAVDAPRAGMQLVATGEVGRSPTINVFNALAKPMATFLALQGFHRRGVSHLAFSGDGSTLFSVGLDDDHSIAVYKITGDKAGKLLFSAKGNKQKVLHVAGNPFDPLQFVQAGVKHVEFHTLTGKLNAVAKQKCVFGKGGQTNILCVGYESNDTILAGSAKGEVFFFTQNKFKSKVQAHEQTVNSLVVQQATQQVITGGKDGFVHIWSKGLKEKLNSIDLSKMAAFKPVAGIESTVIRALSPSEDTTKLIIGTASASIFEVTVADPYAPESSKHLTAGHSDGELWGLACNPNKAQYCTVGDEGLIRIWDCETRALRETCSSIKLNSKSRAVAYSPDGKKIAVGFGGGGRGNKKDGKEGSFRIYSEDKLELLHEIRDSKQYIGDIRFSPDGKTLAVASHDNSVYLYDVLKHFKRKAKVNKHTSYITHIDFSRDSRFLQTTCGAYELLFSETNKGQQITSASSLRNTQWDTWTCTLGWPVQGIWPKGADGTDVNSVCRSMSEEVIATTDDFGQVKLFSYPCVEANAMSVEYRGHSSHVTTCRFTHDDKHLITTGGMDKCVFQWKHEVDGDDDASDAESDPEDDSYSEEKKADVEDEESPSSSSAPVEFEERGGGDEFMAVKPWLGAIVPPSGPPKDTLDTQNSELNDHLRTFSMAHNAIPRTGKVDNHDKLVTIISDVKKGVDKVRRGIEKESSAPEDSRLELEWIHGYTSSGDSRGNIRYTSSGDLVYHAAAVGVTLSEANGVARQKFMHGHDDDVTALAIHPEGAIVATGQIGKKPKIVVWDTASQKKVQTIEGFHTRGISRLAFSSDGSTLISIGSDTEHSIALYDWANNKLKSSAKGDKSKLLDVCFAPNSNSDFATVGVKHVKFWTAQGRNLSGKKGILGKVGKLQAFPCCAYVNQTFVMGTAGGELYVFADRNLKRTVTGHAKGVTTFFVTPDAQLVSGGKDGKVKLFDQNFNPTREFDMNDKLAGISWKTSIRSACTNAGNSKLVIGTEGSEIFELDISDGKADVLHGKDALVAGHYKDELWGVAENPTTREFATVGDDGLLRVWDLTTKRLRGPPEGISSKATNTVDLGGMARAVCYSPDGKLIAVGFGGSVGRGRQKNDGEFAIYNANDLQQIHKAKDSKEWIQDLKFSPDGNTLAVGSHDNNVYFYDKKKSWKLRSKFNKHSSFITHLDFSADSQFLRTNCGAYEMLFSDVFTGNQIKSASSLRNTEWDSWSCILGWPVQGIWSGSQNGSDINACVRSNAGQVLVTGGDDGLVKMYQYPCVNKKAGCEDYEGHSSHVTNVRWSLYDEYCLTVGGGDRCIFQWKHEVEEVEGAGQGKFRRMSTTTAGLVSELEAEEEDVVEAADEMAFEARGGGDEFMAVKPYLGAIKAPKGEHSGNPLAPKATIEVSWVHGYNGLDVRYGADGGVCYSAAGLGVSLKRESGGTDGGAQKVCQGHDDDVQSFCVSGDRGIMATGQMGKVPCIKIWDTESCLLLATLNSNELKRGVTNVAFSKTGDKLVAVGNDDDHTHVVFEDKGGRWSSVVEGASGKGDKAKVLWTEWDGDETIVSGGVKFLKFFSVEGKTLKSKKGVFGKEGKIQPLPCGCIYTKEDKVRLVTGTADGYLYLWEDRVCVRSVKCEGEGVEWNDKVKGVFSCKYVEYGEAAPGEEEKGGRVVCGDKAGNVFVFDEDLVCLKAFGLGSGVRGVGSDGCVKSVDMVSGKILAGLKNGTIVEISAKGGEELGVVCRGHGDGEVWGLGVNYFQGSEDLYATSGDDMTVRVWSGEGKKMLCMCKLGYASRCLEWKDARTLGVGLGDGRKNKGKKGKEGGFAILRLEEEGGEWKLVKVAEEVGKKAGGVGDWVSDIKFSRKGDLMALGSHDNHIYVYSVGEKGGGGGVTVKLKGKMAGHSSYITHLDFDAAGKFLQSNCGAYELLFWSMKDCKQVKSASSLKDVAWLTFTCVLGWPMQEIWPAGGDGTDVNSSCVGAAKKFVITGDDFGKVNVFNYPVIVKGSACLEGVGHSSHVTNVRFKGREEKEVVSTGGGDRCVIVWSLKDSE